MEELLATGGAGRPLARARRLAGRADRALYRVGLCADAGQETGLQGGLVEGVRGEVRGVREGIVSINITVNVS